MNKLIELDAYLDEVIELRKKPKKDRTIYQAVQNTKTGKTARIPMKRNWFTGVYSPNKKHPEYDNAMKTIGELDATVHAQV